MHRLALPPDRIADLAEELLAGGEGGWSMGVEGALAEFAVTGGQPQPEVRRRGRRVEALAAGGGLRLSVADGTMAFVAAPDRPGEGGTGTVYLAVPRSILPPRSLGVTVVAGDADSLRRGDRHDLVADLALPAAARFCVRTGDGGLVARLRAVEGAAWREALDAVGPALVAASPHRVVTTPLGRIEVYTPIPAPGGESPAGPHTHLIPALLETGRELPGGVELPPGLVPAAAFHPPPGWTAPAA